MNNLYNPPQSGYPGITSQTDVTASRALDGTIYQNTSVKPMTCLVTVALAAAGGISVVSDSQVNPTTVISASSNGGLVSIPWVITFVVLPGNYYGINDGGSSLTKWFEYL